MDSKETASIQEERIPQEGALILASASPRRAVLLEQAGIEFRSMPAGIDEGFRAGESPGEHVLRLAGEKAETVSSRFPKDFVLGADTAVVVDDRILGKPGCMQEAAEMLMLLSGRVHSVLTGVCLLRRRPQVSDRWVSRTLVTFRHLDRNAVKRYLGEVNPLDKAGGYGIQERGQLLVKEICGLRSNVIGLPVEELTERLEAMWSKDSHGGPGAETD